MHYVVCVLCTSGCTMANAQQICNNSKLMRYIPSNEICGQLYTYQYKSMPRAKHHGAVNTCWWALVGCYTSIVDGVNDFPRRASASWYAQGGADLVGIRVTSFRTRGCTVTENLTFNFTLWFCVHKGGGEEEGGGSNNSHTELCIT